jgi:hypothetical protein
MSIAHVFVDDPSKVRPRKVLASFHKEESLTLAGKSGECSGGRGEQKAGKTQGEDENHIGSSPSPPLPSPMITLRWGFITLCIFFDTNMRQEDNFRNERGAKRVTSLEPDVSLEMAPIKGTIFLLGWCRIPANLRAD